MKLFERLALSAVAFLVFAALVAWLAGIYYNRTTSYPKGIYRVTGQIPQKNNLVVFCLPDNDYATLAKVRGYVPSGFCDSGLLPLLKRLVAVPGDTVTLTKQGVSVNGEPVLPNTQPKQVDPTGRSLPSRLGELSIPDGFVYLVSDYNANSYDSRYFGAVPITAIKGPANDLITWQ